MWTGMCCCSASAQRGETPIMLSCRTERQKGEESDGGHIKEVKKKKEKRVGSCVRKSPLLRILLRVVAVFHQHFVSAFHYSCQLALCTGQALRNSLLVIDLPRMNLSQLQSYTSTHSGKPAAINKLLFLFIFVVINFHQIYIITNSLCFRHVQTWTAHLKFNCCTCTISRDLIKTRAFAKS